MSDYDPEDAEVFVSGAGAARFAGLFAELAQREGFSVFVHYPSGSCAYFPGRENSRKFDEQIRVRIESGES